MKRMRQGICALCGEKGELRKSHIIPKFVFKELKKGSFSEKFRATNNPNRALQDGSKLTLLCDECEARFSENEKYFNDRVLQPTIESGFNTIEYEGDRLNYFIVSLSWRSLYLDINGENNFTGKELEILKQAEDIMRKYLLRKTKYLGEIENHILFTDNEFEGNDSKMLEIIDLMQRGTFSYTVCKRPGIYIFSNIMGILIITVIKRHREDSWRNTRVKNIGGKISAPQKGNSIIFDDLHYVNNRLQQSREELTTKQKEQLIDKIAQNPEKFKSSKSFVNNRINKR